MTKNDKVREVTLADGIRIKTESKPRLYEAILYNHETKEEENRSDPMEYDDALAWARENKDDQTYPVVCRSKTSNQEQRQQWEDAR